MLAEGMAARRPVIAQDLGAAPEIVRHAIDGFIIPPFDVARAMTHLETLADDPARMAAMGAAGRARASEHSPCWRRARVAGSGGRPHRMARLVRLWHFPRANVRGHPRTSVRKRIWPNRILV